MSAFEVRQAGPSDVPALEPLFEAYRAFYGRPPSGGEASVFLGDRLTQRQSTVFLAVAGPACIGFVQLYPTFSSLSMKRLWILNDLFVVPEARRGGAAAALLARARQLAQETHAEGLALETAVGNAAAQSLYEKLGWKKDEAFFRYHLDLA